MLRHSDSVFNWYRLDEERSIAQANEVIIDRLPALVEADQGLALFLRNVKNF